METAARELGEELLALRVEFDPLDDAFRAIGPPRSGLPEMTDRWTAEMQSKLSSIYDRLPGDGEAPESIDFEIARHQAKELTNKLTMRLWATFLSGYDYSPLGRVTGTLPSLDVGSASERARFLETVASVGPYIESCIDSTIEAARSGRAPLASSVEQSVERWRQLLKSEGIALAPEGSPDPLKRQVGECFSEFAVRPIERYLNALEVEVRPFSRPDSKPGMCHLDRGEEHYQQLIDSNTDNFGSAEQIHTYGLSEVSRLQEKLRQLHDKPDGATVSITRMLEGRGGDECYAGADEFMAELEGILLSAEEDFAEVLDLDDLEPLVVERIPEHLSASSPTAYYLPGGEGGIPGKIMINPLRMVGEPRGSAMAMIYHESIPGHHVQFEDARRAALPPFRKSAWFNAFIEGWGLYAEELAEELGLYETHSAKVGKVGLELFRAARLVVDTGLHAKGWSVPRAQRYLVDSAGLSPATAENEVFRYVEYPAQALSYATGKTQMLSLREATRRRQGAAFDLRYFHSQVLRHGTAPISSIAPEMEKAC